MYKRQELDGVKEGVSFCVFPSSIVRFVWFRAIPLSGVVTTGISYRYVRELDVYKRQYLISAEDFRQKEAYQIVPLYAVFCI